mmetsp:Transcript_43252/g.57227  ORF Transcript_43252/g.57227 Transcript_43252/m.57227 type:complete len:149 (-) Transcript_43252:452-898(-)
MSYIHELCLVKWLLAKNIRYCELCKAKFTIKEEMGSLWEIVKSVLLQSLRSKKRVTCALIYGVYLYFLGKRFFSCAEYLSKTVVRGLISFLGTYLSLAFAEVKFLCTFASLPFRNERIKLFQSASKLWLEQIRLILTPEWLLKLRSQN